MMLLNDSDASPRHATADAAPENPARALRRALADVVPLRGWKLQRVADALAVSIDRELTDGDAAPGDVEARQLVARKYVRTLGDALVAEGPFAREARSADLLAIRYDDRAAFESYGRLHARLTDLARQGGTEAITLPEMLLALRLRMLCLDWATISLVHEGLKKPCDEAALRKRHSRLVEIAAADVSAAEDWARIDGYLKARRRSFGGTRRRVPLVPIVALCLLLAGLGVWAMERWFAPAPPKMQDAPNTSPPARVVIPPPMEEKTKERVAEEGDSPPESPPVVPPSTKKQSSALIPSPPKLAYLRPLETTGERWQSLSTAEQLLAWRWTPDERTLELRGAVLVPVPWRAMRRFLTDPRQYRQINLHLVKNDPVSGIEWQQEWHWIAGERVAEDVRIEEPSDASINMPARIAPQSNLFESDRTDWLLRPEKFSTIVQYSRVIHVARPDLRRELREVLVRDVADMLGNLVEEARGMVLEPEDRKPIRHPCSFDAAIVLEKLKIAQKFRQQWGAPSEETSQELRWMRRLVEPFGEHQECDYYVEEREREAVGMTRARTEDLTAGALENWL